jgi:hypothetical protein
MRKGCRAHTPEKSSSGIMQLWPLLRVQYVGWLSELDRDDVKIGNGHSQMANERCISWSGRLS